MDNHNPILGRIKLIAAHLRFIAGLMLTGEDLKEVELASFALVMEDLSVRLEEAMTERSREILGNTARTGSASHDGT